MVSRMNLDFTTLLRHTSATLKPSVARAPVTANRKTEHGLLQKTQDKYEVAMSGKGWMLNERVAALVGTDIYSARITLHKMRKAGLVELDDDQKNDRGRPLYLWQWK